MLTTAFILNLLAARDDSDSGVKLVFGVIVVVIWIIGAVMSAMKKKGQQENQQYVQQDWSHLLRDLTAGQNKPFNPGMPAPPQVPPSQMRPQQPQRLQPAGRQQVKSFAQQSPRPFVQQYRPQIPQRPAPQVRKAIQPPRPIQKRPKTQRRPPPLIPAQAVAVRTPPQAQVGLIEDSAMTMGQIGGATSVQTSTARAGHGPLTRSQLRKLILWSEVLGPPLAIRE